MAQGTLWLAPIQRAFNNNGAAVAASCKAYFYLAGTTTPVSVYSDVALTTSITQPVTADANGIFQEIFLTPGTAYKVDVQTAAGVSLTGYPADNQLAIPASAATVDQTETAGEALTAGLVCYLSDGSGGKNGGQLYKADSANQYSSTSPVVGMVPSAISSGSTGTFRIAGQITGLTSLTPGTDYFVGTSGALTATAPANARYVGTADSTSSLIINADPRPTFISPVIKTSVVTPAAGLFYGVCQGRLTLTTATPVTSTNVTAATTLYFTPYLGANIGLYDGTTNWTILPFAELSIAVPATTSQMYDVFVYNNSGTAALELLAWTNDTTRATALALQNGVYCKTGALTRRYVGSFRTTTVSGQTEDSVTKRYVWNYYNRVRRGLQRFETTTNWNYNTATLRQANGSTSNQVDIVVGVQETWLQLSLYALAGNGNLVNLSVGIGEGSTTTIATESLGNTTINLAGGTMQLSSFLAKSPVIGRQFYTWLEYSTNAGTTTWYAAGGTVNVISGLSGWIDG